MSKEEKINTAFYGVFKGKLEKQKQDLKKELERAKTCLLYTSPSPRDRQKSRMPSSA